MESDYPISIPQDNTIDSEEATRLLKYFAIEPAIYAQQGQVARAIKEAASKRYIHPVTGVVYSFSIRTLYRYLKAFRKSGLNGLVPGTYRNKGRPKNVSKEMMERIFMLKKELPIRSARKIIVLLEISGEIEKGILKERTVSRLLKENGYTRKVLSKSRKLYKKVVVKSIYQLYQSDITESWILDENGKSRKVYLFVVIDTYSRFVVHAQFYLDSNLLRLENCLKKAITKYGLCKNLFVDNGSVYISNHFRLACADLGIRLIHSTVYYPQSRGVNERFNRTFKEDFMSEVKLYPVKDVRVLNERLFAWLDMYHKEEHPELKGKSHGQVWEECIRNGVKPRLVSPVKLTQAFYHKTERTVGSYGTISFQTNDYEVDSALIGEKVTARYDPFNLKELFVYHKERFVCRARLIDLSREKHSDYDSVEKDPKTDPVSGINYTEILGEQFKKMMEEQADSLMEGNREVKNADTSPACTSQTDDVSIKKENAKRSSKDTEPDDSNSKEKDYAISMDEFIKTVSEFMGINTLSYQQKDLLQSNYEDFKVFNPELLKKTLDNLRMQYPDSSQNILFYLKEIRKRLNEI